jgi:hypothetical protein
MIYLRLTSIFFIMEEFLKKRSYLYHLKTISAIKNGHLKPRFDLPKTSTVNFNTLR